MAATDAALELLEQIQHDLGEGPHLQAYAQDQPVGTLDVYSTQPRAWTAHELEAMGEFASVAGELVQTSVQLASRELEVAQLQQALTSRVWTEQAKGVLAATRGTDPEVTFQQLRARARASSRRLAELPARSSRTPNASGWPPWPWRMSGSRGPTWPNAAALDPGSARR